MAKEMMYWMVEGDPAKEVLHDFRKRENDIVNLRWAFMGEIGNVKEFVEQGNSLIGLVFTEKAPIGWKADKNGHWHVPDGKTKEGRIFKKRLLSLKSPSSWELSKSMLGIEMVFDNSRWYSAGYETIGDNYIVKAFASKDWKPIEGLREMKDSEYWLMKESVEKAS